MSDTGAPLDRVVVAVSTYRRNADLEAALESLAGQVDVRAFRVVVVDNDPDASAREVTLRSPIAADYVHEPRPGIAAVRNATLRAIAPEEDALVFVDDDETFDPQWLSRLWRFAEETAADIVGGPVVTHFPPEAPRWMARGGFIQRSRMPSGVLVGKYPATNNVLVRTRYWRAAGSPMFDEAFSFTGGSDSDFFSRLISPGDRVMWCDEAVAHEGVPPERQSARWVLRRMVRLGNVDGRLRLRSESRASLVIGAVPRIGYGAVRTLGSLVVGRGVRKKDVRYITLGIGWLGAVTNTLVIEYARKAET